MRRFMAAASVAVFVILAVGLRSGGEEAGSWSGDTLRTDETSATQRIPAYRWPEGATLTYRFSLEDRGAANTTRPGSQQALKLDAGLSAAGELEVRVLKSDADGALLQVRVSDVTSGRWTMMGTTLNQRQVAAELTGPTGKGVTVSVDSDGTVREVRFAEGRTLAGGRILERLIRQSLTPVGDGSEALATPFGTALTTLAVDGTKTGHDLIARRTAADYSEFTFVPAFVEWHTATGKGTSRSVLNERGILSTSESSEHIALTADNDGKVANVGWQSSLRLTDVTVVPRSPAGNVATVTPDVKPSSRANRTQVSDQRIGAMTLDKIVSDIERYGAGGVMPYHERWLWQATGLLTRHPELAATFAKMAMETDAKPRARELLLDLLANVGHAEAQAALREALGSEVLKSAPTAEYTALIQRFSLLKNPDDESVAFIAQSYQEQELGDVRYGAATAYGSVIDRLSHRDPDAASLHAQLLADHLVEATEPVEQRALIGALGNAARPEHGKVLGEFARSELPAVRNAVAHALELHPSPDASDVLLGLMADGSASVRETAMDYLGRRDLTANQVSALLKKAMDAETQESPTVLTALLERLMGKAEPGALLEVATALRKAPTTDRETRHRLFGLEQRLEAKL